ncbi:hypothetical protein [Dictyobacter halimunensis]|uniref:hypothetical protein n=1 Tax=Dictyobacter halimunensis TaxID=3026934 RepID=UPI0030C73CE0
MLEKISLGIFYPGTSVIHRLQARTKVLIIVWLIGTLLIANHRQWHFIPYIVAIALMLAGVLASGISLRDFGKRLWFLVLIVFSSLLISIFGAVSDGRVIWSLGPWRLGYASLQQDLLWLCVASLVFLGWSCCHHCAAGVSAISGYASSTGWRCWPCSAPCCFSGSLMAMPPIAPCRLGR